MRKLYIFTDPNIDRQIEEIVKNTYVALPVFANNAAAVAAGLMKDKPYRTATGQLMVVY